MNEKSDSTTKTASGINSITASAETNGGQIQGAIRRIVLTGFMAAGKTTVGSLLATQLGWKFVDADSRIEALTGVTIAEFFRLYGEPSFRELERRTIAEALADKGIVLALGGGAIEDDGTRQLLTQAGDTRLVFLEASLETSLIRAGVSLDSDHVTGPVFTRPVLADRANIKARFERRLPLYRQSHYTVAVDELGAEAVAEAILAALREELAGS